MRDSTRRTVLFSFAVAILLTLNSIGPVHSVPPPINPEPASVVIGQPDFTSYASGNGPGGLSEPEFVAFDHSGDLWVSDYNNSLVAEYNQPFTNGESAALEVGSASFSTTGCSNTGPSNVCSPNGIAFDQAGNLWVADSENNSIVEFKAPFTAGESSSTVIGQYSDGQPNATNLDQPFGIAFDSSGNLWVADSSDNRVVEYKAPLANDESASLVLGQTSLTSATDNDAQSNMSSPEDIAFDGSGNLWVADTGNSRVLEFTQPFSNGERAGLVVGAPNFTSFNGNDTQSTLTLPEAIAFDHSGNLWVSDSGNSRVIEFASPFTTGMNASRLIGQVSYVYGGPNATQTMLGYPDGLTFDGSGNLWVADSGFARVLEYSDPLTYSAASSSTTSSAATTSSPPSTSSVASASSVATTSSTSSASGGGVPVFPYQFVMAAAFTVVLVASYLLIRRGSILRGTAGLNATESF
ncbi:MAG: NHL repeat-containing protein [Thaumarchaeota archaeon]|nr:NHL repeat-containing protein [Nitrososphaerota archaeon]